MTSVSSFQLHGVTILLLSFFIAFVNCLWWSSGEEEQIASIRSTADVHLYTYTELSEQKVLQLEGGDHVVLLHGEYFIEVTGGRLRYKSDHNKKKLDLDYVCSDALAIFVCDYSDVCEEIVIFNEEYLNTHPKGSEFLRNCNSDSDGVVLSKGNVRACIPSDTYSRERFVSLEERKQATCALQDCSCRPNAADFEEEEPLFAAEKSQAKASTITKTKDGEVKEVYKTVDVRDIIIVLLILALTRHFWMKTFDKNDAHVPAQSSHNWECNFPLSDPPTQQTHFELNEESEGVSKNGIDSANLRNQTPLSTPDGMNPYLDSE